MTRFLLIFLIAAISAYGQRNTSINNGSLGSTDTLQTFMSVGNGVNGTIEDMAVYDDKLYVAGKFIDNGKEYTIAYWDGKNWAFLSDGIDGSRTIHSDGVIMILAVYRNELYVGGDFTKVGGEQVYNIAKWNGKDWTSVGQGLKGYFASATENINGKNEVVRYTNGYVNYMAEYNNELYVSGCFDSAGTVPLHNFAKWNGKKWIAIGKGANGNIGAIQQYKKELYVGGEFDTLDGKPFGQIAKWDGKQWSSVGSGTWGGDVRCLAVFDSNLYVGGCYRKVGDSIILGIAKWDGNVWSSVGGGMNISRYGSICSLEIYKNELYASGLFDSAGSVPARNIAKWNTKKWEPLKANEVIPSDSITLLSAEVNGKICYVGVSGGVSALIEYHNDLYISGSFYTKNTHHSMNIVIWKKGVKP